VTKRAEVSLGEHAVLALIAEEPRHGWAVVRELAPGGALGRVWTLSRPLAYRALEQLAAQRLIRATGTEPGEGPRRTIYATTAAGRRELERWLDTPVEHPRDVRSELLLKLAIAKRRGIDTRRLLRAQQRVFRPAFAGLEKAARTRDADIVDTWRHESALAIQRFIDRELRAR
jgi:DNA-binding PadR family transcriptional regulator